MEIEKGLLKEIREKEEECYLRLDEAKQDADRTLADARQETEEILARADAEGRDAAKRHYDAEMVNIQKEVSAIREEGAILRLQIAERGRRNIPPAVKQILSAVAPGYGYAP